MVKVTTRLLQISIFLSCLLSFGLQFSFAQTICIQQGSDQIKGEKDGYGYELWNQDSQGTACMTLDEGALFSGEWSDIQNYLARRGLNYDQTLLHQTIGPHYATFDCDYRPSGSSGNSYLSIYGWTVEPLIEFYIVEDWRNWIPSMAEGAVSKGSITVNGSTYDIYENTRVNKPSIVGTATFQQYFSIRRDERNSGTINISDHFDKWESLGMYLGKMSEVSFVVEGYQSDGSFSFNGLDIWVGNAPLNTSDVKDDKPINIYPNPADENVTILVAGKEQLLNLKIYNSTGELVYDRFVQSNTSIHPGKLKKGIYIVTVSGNHTNYSTKLVIS